MGVSRLWPMARAKVDWSSRQWRKRKSVALDVSAESVSRS
jgi:hypothetical protein